MTSKTLFNGLLAASLLLSSTPALFMPAAQADGLIQLRPLNGASTVSNNTTTVSSSSTGRIKVEPWQPTGVSSTSNDFESSIGNSPYNVEMSSSSTPYRSSVSAFAGEQKLTIRLNERISSQDMRVGDTISATLEAPLMSGSTVIAPAGSEVIGSIISVSDAKRAGVHGEVEPHFYTIVKPNGERVAIDASVATESGDPEIKPNSYAVDAARGVGIAAAGTGIGALTGTAVGGIFSAAGSGAALGTAVGAAAGIGYALWRKGKPVELPKGALLQLQARDPNKVTTAKN